MKTLSRVLTGLTLSTLCFTNGLAQEDIPDWQVLLQLDNDLFAEADRDYTSGVRIGFLQEVPASTDKGKRMARRLEEGASRLTNRLKSFRISDSSDLRFARGFGLTQLMFTPDNPRSLVAPEGQRPYAGWLGLEYSLHVKDRNYANSVTFTLGSTGDGSLAQESQNWVHRNISNSPLFQGWDSQVPSEITANIHFDHKQRFRGLLSKSLGDLEFDGYYETGMSLGNFRTDAYLGGLARVGVRLPSNFSTPRVRLGSFGQELFSDTQSDERKLSTFLFAGLRGVAVAHDITLDGPIFRDYDGAVSSKSLVGEALYGLGFRYRNIDLVFSQTLRSKEFEGQDKSQKFGSVMFGFRSGFN